MICFPLVLWLANVGLFVTFIYKIAINEFPIPILEGFYSCNIAINIYATCKFRGNLLPFFLLTCVLQAAIIYQILRVARRHSGGSDLYEICRIIVECGLPYLFSTVFQVTVMAIGTDPSFFPSNCALVCDYNALISPMT